MSTRITMVSVVAACTLACGCGETEQSFVRAPVKGTVIASGDALKTGTIRFVPIDGTNGPIAVTTVKEGRYEFTADDGPVIGKHKVEVLATDFLGFDPGDQQAAEQALRSGGARPRSPVPVRFSRNTPLRADVPPEGLDQLDFQLTAR